MNEIRKSAGMVRTRAGSLLVYALLTAVASGMAVQADGQTFAEWFKQKSTQKKYLLQQIAALQVYSDYLQKGYQVARQGLGSISGHLSLENGIHAGYYQKLETAGPLVRQKPQLSEILSWQKDILNRFNSIANITGLGENEKIYLNAVRDAVLKDGDNRISQLQEVLTNGQLEMSDSERLGLIATTHQAMQENFRFASVFTEQVRLYALQRGREHQDAATIKKLYDIH